MRKRHILAIIIVLIILIAIIESTFHPLGNLLGIGIGGGCFENYDDSLDIDHLHQDSKNNTYLVGHDFSNQVYKTRYSGIEVADSSNNLLLVKFNPTGSLIFSHSFGGNGTDYISHSIMDSEENLILIGETNSPKFLGYDLNGTSNFILKMDSNGDIIWVRFVEQGDNYIWFQGMDLDLNNTIFIVGFHHNPLQIPITHTIGSSDYDLPGFILSITKDGEIDDYVLINGLVDDIKILQTELILHLSDPINATFQPRHLYFASFDKVSFELNWESEHIGTSFDDMVLLNQSLIVMGKYIYEQQKYRFISAINDDWEMRMEVSYGTHLLEVFDDTLYLGLKQSLYKVDYQNNTIDLLFDKASELNNFYLSGDLMIILGQTTDPDLITNASFQDHILGEQDHFIMVFDQDQMLWNTYFGGLGYYYEICLL
ncbi:MAG: hypothetical protein INQ03_10470 [Candidatus Heimdallarchaeota archaeon]|nr:hypothetical protein [Candidatus Heimdallarchaeota archaeon]